MWRWWRGEQDGAHDLATASLMLECTIDDFRRYHESEFVKWGKIAKENNIRFDPLGAEMPAAQSGYDLSPRSDQ
jgi:hypothetical protein